jgi:hypothetical protein
MIQGQLSYVLKERELSRKLRAITILLLGGLFLLLGTAFYASSGRAQESDGSEHYLAFSNSPDHTPNVQIQSSDQTVLSLSANLPGSIEKDVQQGGQWYSRLYGDGYGVLDKQGFPALPVLRKQVEVPWGSNVSLQLVSSTFTEHTLSELGLHPIYPLQPPVPKVAGAAENAPFIIDQQYYTS